MYNYIGIIRKSNSVTHCINCNFFGEEKLNLVLSKTDRIEFYDLIKGSLTQNRYINIYGKVNLLLSIPSRDKRYKLKDNIFVLSDDLDFALFSYNKTSNNIDSLITGCIKEEIGRKQDNILYSLDILKNFLLISAFKNIFKLICVNNEMRIIEKYKDFTIKYNYEDILFLTPFSLNFYPNEENNKKDNEKHLKNLLNFATIKTDIIDTRNNNITQINNSDLQQEISLETFQIKIDINNYIYYPYSSKSDLIYRNKNSLLNPKKEDKNSKSIDTYYMEDINFLQKIDITENPTVSLMITHPDGIVMLFFSNYIMYYQFDQKRKKLLSKKDKKISYTDRKFTGYTIVNEKEYKYFVIDEFGNLFLLAFINPFDEEKNNFIFQFLGEINYSTCLTYLDNNYLFVGSYKSNSQLIKIENKNNSFINVVENYESLAPISNLTLINNNEEDENNVELLTISGIEKNCCIKTIKKGTPAVFGGELEINNIKNVFKISFDENDKINTFIVSTMNNSFIIDYDSKLNQISLNNKINFNTKNNVTGENDIIVYAQNIFMSVILMVTNSAILLYKINNKDKDIKLVTRQTFDNNYKIKPLLVKYNEKLNSIFIYFNNKRFLSFQINENGEIMSNKELLNNVNISSFGICKYFIIYSQWDSDKLGIYTINTNKNNFMSKFDNSLDFVQISSIEIIKIEGIRFVILSLSNGKLIYFKLKEQFRNYNYYEFTETDFIFKRKYNLTNENFTIRKIKIKENNSIKKYLFLDTTTPSFIYFNKETPILLNLNIKHCKNILQFEENEYLFVYNHKIFFGSLSNVQSQNVHSKLYGKQLYNIEVISFGNCNLNVFKGEGIEMKENQQNEKIINNNKQKISNYILAIEEEKIDNNNNIKSSLVLSDEFLKEISRYYFSNKNEICTSFSQIYSNNDIENKLIVVGTGISENPHEEPVLGYLYLIEIDINNNFSMKKIKEIEIKGGVYKIRAYKNIIYVSIGNTLLIYKMNKNLDIKDKNYDSYDIKFIRKCTDFTLINDIYIYDYHKSDIFNNNNKQVSQKDEKKNSFNLNKVNSINNEFEESKEEEDFIEKINFSDDENKKNKENKIKIEENIHYLIISDLYRSVVLYSYDVNNDKFNEICRDYNLTWVYGISQYQNNLLYISDIDGNIVSLEKYIQPKSDQEKFKFERRAYFNLGERINSLVMTHIKNNKLYLLSSENNKYDIINNNENLDENDQNNKVEEEVKVTYFGTLEGSVGIIISLNKEVFNFLKVLQNLILKKVHNNGNFNYQKWRSFKDGFNLKTSKGFIEGQFIEDFLNFDESYKQNLLTELNYPWNKTLNDVINIIETLAKCH